MLDNAYILKKVYACAAVMLVVGGFNIGLMALTGKNVISSVFGTGSLVANAIFLAIGVSALALGFMRDFYLPFLAESVIPCSVLSPSTPDGANVDVRVHAAPNAKVLYWAAEPANADLHTVVTWKQAYLGFRNAGVVVADSDGYATLRVRTPQAYTVPMKGELDAHVHYRVCGAGGMIGRVQTVSLAGKEQFANYVSRQEMRESVDGMAPPVVAAPDAAAAMADIQSAVNRTADAMLMAAGGAAEEGPQPAGAILSEAYPGAV